LLIEDDQWLADSLVSTLRSRGHNVVHLSTAHEAIAWIDSHKPALIIADVLLGEQTTFALFHELQSYGDTATIPVILCTSLTAHHFESIDQKSYGIVEILDKATLTPDRLVLSVEAHLPQKRGIER
jgi:DNA-binding response OmpR family regulator